MDNLHPVVEPAATNHQQPKCTRVLLDFQIGSDLVNQVSEIFHAIP